MPDTRDDKLTILIPVDHAVGISGPHRNVVGTLNALTARDDTAVVLVTGEIDADAPYARAKNIDIRYGFDPHDPRRMFTNLRLLHAAARDCHLIYVPTNLKSLLLSQVIRYRRPLIAGPNVSHLPLPYRKDAPGRIELSALCDVWLEASEARTRHVRRHTRAGTILTMHHAIDLNAFSPRRRLDEIWAESGVPPTPLKILYVGKDSTLKGVTQLLDAFDLAVASGADELHLILVGAMSDTTMARIDGQPHITALGFRTGNELAALYASADLAVVPSSWENFSFAVLEAMASGLPIIAARTGGIPEMIDDGESGILLDLTAPDGTHRVVAAQKLAGAITALARDPDRRHMLGAAARLRAEDRFSESRLGNDLVALFRSVRPVAS